MLAGELVTLTIGVANAGPSPATGTGVTIAVPDGFAVRAATPSQGTCTIVPPACAARHAGARRPWRRSPSSCARPSAGSIPVTIAATAEQADRTPADDTRVFDVASTDDTAPRSLRVKGTTLQRPFQTGTDIQLGWSAVDSGTGVSRYDVRYRKGTSAGRFAAVRDLAEPHGPHERALPGRGGRHLLLLGARRRRRRQRVALQHREVHGDPVRRDGPVTPWRVGARGVEDGLPRGDLRSSRRGATLVRAKVRAKRISLLATVCRGCGTVEVRLGARLLKTVSLAAPVTRTRQILPVLLATGIRSGTLTIRVTSDRKIVRIDGLGLSSR